MRYLYNILAILLLAIFVSCEKQEQVGGYDTDGKLNITLKCVQMESAEATKFLETPLPDEGTGTDYKVQDYWILQYDSKGNYINNSAQYVVAGSEEEGKTAVVMPEKNQMNYCLFIANTHDPNLSSDFEEFQGSFAAMTQFYNSITSLEETYSVTDKGDKDLIMSGIAELESGAKELKCFLYRNIAKVTVTLDNLKGSELTIKSINIKNIPAGALYADALYKVTKVKSLPGVKSIVATSTFPDSYSIPYIDYTLDDINVTSGTKESFVWYLPRNFKGVVSEVASADMKNKFAPELATYIEVFAVTSDNKPYRYKFYLGANPTTDFNVEPNIHYKLPITFVDKGNVVDSRVGDFGVIELSAKSNSFIINPLPIDKQALYQLPVSRVNEFWGSNDAPAGADNKIGEKTEWIAEVIWQDQKNKRLINFIDANGNAADNFTATGEKPFTFEVLKGAKGNVLVGVRKSNSNTYLWSWHLWITDYNPDECTNPWIQDKYTYFVSGGQVHRYAGDIWENEYQNRYIMDRNLGALSADRKMGLSMTGGFFYQFGRKDPIPANNITLYDITGENVISPINVITDNVPVPIAVSVQKPYNFYACKGDWASDNTHTSVRYTWNGDVEGKKSIYDPCPEGWMIPKNETWNIFGSEEKINRNSAAVMYHTEEAGVEFYVEAPYGESNKEYNTAFFPAYGFINVDPGKEGQWGHQQEAGYVHSTQGTPNVTNMTSLYFSLKQDGSAKVRPTYSSSRSKGLNVRCIREKGIATGNDQENNKKNEEYNQVPW